MHSGEKLTSSSLRCLSQHSLLRRKLEVIAQLPQTLSLGDRIQQFGSAAVIRTNRAAWVAGLQGHELIHVWVAACAGHNTRWRSEDFKQILATCCDETQIFKSKMIEGRARVGIKV